MTRPPRIAIVGADFGGLCAAIQLKNKLARTTWAQAGASWYKNEAGRITNNWPESTLSYWIKTRRFEPGAYRMGP